MNRSTRNEWGKFFLYFLPLLLIGIPPVFAGAYLSVDITDSGCETLFGYQSGVHTSGCNERIKVLVKNLGDAACTNCKVEAGIYTKNQVNQWYSPLQVLSSGSGVLDVPNCVSTETNVDTALINIQPGDQKLIDFTVKAPIVGSTNTEYGIHVQSFINCYNTGLPVGAMSYDVMPLTVVGGSVQPVASCNDGFKNQDESDTDCGGKSCAKCPIGLVCTENNDCASGLNCLWNPSRQLWDCRQGTQSPSDPPTQQCGNSKVDPYEDCNTCAVDVPGCTKEPFQGAGTAWYANPLYLGGALIGALLLLWGFKRP